MHIAGLGTENISAIVSKSPTLAHSFSIREHGIPGIEAGTLLPPNSEEPRCWWTTVQTIADNEYNLAAGRYKPRIAEEIPDEDPAQLISQVLEIEGQIVEGLQKLLQEVETVE